MGKSGLAVRGLHAGQAAKVLAHHAKKKTEKQWKESIKYANLRDLTGLRDQHCFTIPLPTVDDDSHAFELWCMNVWHLLENMMKVSSDFKEVVAGAVVDGQLPLILYCDEITCGNPLQPDPSRKILMWYLAPKAGRYCTHEHTWGIWSCIRAHNVKKIAGGVATIFAKLLQCFFDRAEPHLLWIAGKHQLVDLTIDLVIADEAALHALLACKGASGRKPCFKCTSLVSKMCMKQLEDLGTNEHHQTLHHPTLDDVRGATDVAIWTALDHLQANASTLTKKHLSEFEKNSGWNLVATSVQCQEMLRTKVPPSRFLYDPLHCYFSQGILGVELQLMRTHMLAAGVSWDHFETSVRRLGAHFQSLHAPNFRAIKAQYFSEDHWKANAASQMGLWPLIHVALLHSLSTEQRDRLKDNLASFTALCEELHHIAIIKHSSTLINVPVLKHVQENHMRRFVQCYGANACRPKHHYRLHLGPGAAIHQHLYDCLVMERKHRMTKQEVNTKYSNLQHIDDWILSRLCLLQFEEMKNYRILPRLVSTTELAFGSVRLTSDTPLLFVELGILLRPQKWWKNKSTFQVQGDLYRIATRRSPVYTLWTKESTNQILSLASKWMLPTYWRINLRSIETLL